MSETDDVGMIRTDLDYDDPTPLGLSGLQVLRIRRRDRDDKFIEGDEGIVCELPIIVVPAMTLRHVVGSALMAYERRFPFTRDPRTLAPGIVGTFELSIGLRRQEDVFELWLQEGFTCDSSPVGSSQRQSKPPAPSRVM
jgi:hypothetical protein